MTFPEALAAAADKIEARLMQAVDTLPASAVHDAMAHALTGGKRLRGFLVLEGAGLPGVPEPRALQAANASRS